MATATASPVRTLREHVLALEGAIALCLDKPRPKAVHKVRTEARRIEAQLELLGLLKRLPSYRSEMGRSLRLLKKIRRAAGRVRDIDVQRKLLKTHSAEDEKQVEQHTDAKRNELAEGLTR